MHRNSSFPKQPALAAVFVLVAFAMIGCVVGTYISTPASKMGACCLPMECDALRLSAPLNTSTRSLCDVSVEQAETMGCVQAISELQQCGVHETHLCEVSDAMNAAGDLKLIATCVCVDVLFLLLAAAALLLGKTAQNLFTFGCMSTSFAIPVVALTVPLLSALSGNAYVAEIGVGVTFGDLGSGHCKLRGENAVRYSWVLSISTLRILAIFFTSLGGSVLAGGLLSATSVACTKRKCGFRPLVQFFCDEPEELEVATLV